MMSMKPCFAGTTLAGAVSSSRTRKLPKMARPAENRVMEDDVQGRLMKRLRSNGANGKDAAVESVGAKILVAGQ